MVTTALKAEDRKDKAAASRIRARPDDAPGCRFRTALKFSELLSSHQK